MYMDAIKVGNTTMYAESVPVNVIFDGIYDPASFPEDLDADRFKILEMDGYYLTMHECIYTGKPSTQNFKCFLTLEDAQGYLKMFGVDFDET